MPSKSSRRPSSCSTPSHRMRILLLTAKEKERRSPIVYRSKDRESGRFIYREKIILGFAEYHNRSPKRSTSAGARPPPRDGSR